MQVYSKKLTAFLATAGTVIIIDRITKYIIRTTPSLQNFQIIKGWLAFNYTQNPGMALGYDWLPTPVIGLISLLAIIIIMAYILKFMKRATTVQMVFAGLIIGGALGNIFDRMFMGIIQSNGGFMDGRVVDFIHFSLTIHGHPVFPYIFNFADSCITVSVLSLLIFNKYLLPSDKQFEPSEDHQEESLTSEDSLVQNKEEMDMITDSSKPEIS